MTRFSAALFVLGLLLAVSVSAQEAPPLCSNATALEKQLRDRLNQPLEALDLDIIMLGEDFSGAEPNNVRWSADGQTVWFSWKRWNERERGTFSYALGRGKADRLTEIEEVPNLGQFDPTRRRRVYAQGDALYLHDLRSSEIREILRWDRSLSDFRFDSTGNRLFIVSDQSVFELNLVRGGLHQLLTVGSEKPEEPKEPDETTLKGWHEARQLELFRVLSEQKEREDRTRTERKARETARHAVTTYIPPTGWTVETMTVAPDGRHVTVGLTKGSAGKGTEMPDYVTRSGYTTTRPTRPKVGDAMPEVRMEVVDVATGEGHQIARPKLREDAMLGFPSWSPDGQRLLLVARTDDDEAVFVQNVDLLTGASETVHFVTDSAWVLWQSLHRPVFLGTTNRAVFLSEADGWSHLYRLDADTGEVCQLTKGRFEVDSVQITPSGDAIYALATPTSPHVKDLVRIDPESGEMTILTADGGGREIKLSPDGRKIAEVFSKANQPWELRIRDVDGKAEPEIVTDSPSPAWKSYGRFEDPEIVEIPASDGVKVPARIYRPKSPHPARPAVLFVHGAGYLQNVHRWWSSYHREYSFHHLLRDAGYTVLDVDYRGSKGYGRDWRTAIFGHMGGRDLEDFVDAARWLEENEGIDPRRIGIYGGSYGGFITLMALFTKPGVFAAGAALRPVTDWAHYNDGYTSNILDDPLESATHYQRSSPINFAEGLRDHLLICHGVLDDNVHVQGVFRLQQRLIELRKSRWEVALYPLERHGFVDPASWTDEYRRIRELFDRVLLP